MISARRESPSKDKKNSSGGFDYSYNFVFNPEKLKSKKKNK